MQEKRQFTRIPYKASIKLVKENGEKISGEVLNICLKGTYVSLSDGCQVAPNEIVAFSIAFDEIHDMVIKGSAVVVWHSSHIGYGLYFASVDLVDRINLKRLIAINYNDAKKIEREFEEIIK